MTKVEGRGAKTLYLRKKKEFRMPERLIVPAAVQWKKTKENIKDLSFVVCQLARLFRILNGNKVKRR